MSFDEIILIFVFVFVLAHIFKEISLWLEMMRLNIGRIGGERKLKETIWEGNRQKYRNIRGLIRRPLFQ